MDRFKEVGVVSAVTEVRNEVAEPAVQALNDDLHAIGKQNVTPVELTDAKNSFGGRFILQLERQSGLADQLVRVETMGLPPDYLEMFTTHVRSVEPDQIRQTGQLLESRRRDASGCWRRAEDSKIVGEIRKCASRTTQVLDILERHSRSCRPLNLGSPIRIWLSVSGSFYRPYINKMAGR